MLFLGTSIQIMHLPLFLTKSWRESGSFLQASAQPSKPREVQLDKYLLENKADKFKNV